MNDARASNGSAKGSFWRVSTKPHTSARTTSVTKAGSVAQTSSPSQNSTESYTIEFVGGARAGKTTLIRRLTKRVFEETYQPTSEDVRSATFPVDDLPVTLHIQDRGYARISVARLTRNPAHGLLLVFSVADRETFTYLQRFADIVLSGRFSLPPATVLVGTHAECAEGKRKIPLGQAADLAAHLGVPYMETSALTHRCTAPFYTLVRALRADSSLEADRMRLIQAAQDPTSILCGTIIGARPLSRTSSLAATTSAHSTVPFR